MDHHCDERCTCPIHGTPLLYAPHWDDHACQDASCEHGRGGFDPIRHLDEMMPTLPQPYGEQQ